MAAHKREWREEEIDRLGKDSDSKIALELGLSYSSIRDKRQELGIPAFKYGPSSIPLTEDEKKILYTDISDHLAGLKIGRSRSQINKIRATLGIKTSRSHDDANAVVSQIPVTEKVKQMVEELRNIIVDEFRNKGLPVRKICHWQIVEIAVQEALKKRTKKYAKS